MEGSIHLWRLRFLDYPSWLHLTTQASKCIEFIFLNLLYFLKTWRFMWTAPKLVDEIHYWFLLSQLRYLNKKVNRSANEMLFCLAFHWSFFFLDFSHILISSFLNSNQQLNNNEIWRSFALWFLFFWLLSSFIRGLLKNFFFFLVRIVQLSKWKRKERKTEWKNSWKISSFYEF